MSSTTSGDSVDARGFVMVRRLAVALLGRIGRAVFRKDDEFARQQGWQVQVGRFGLSRAYRHPGFGGLAGCPDCRGSGSRQRADCDRCAGTGRVTLDRRPSPGRR
jgi:hypothetical protein